MSPFERVYSRHFERAFNQLYNEEGKGYHEAVREAHAAAKEGVRRWRLGVQMLSRLPGVAAGAYAHRKHMQKRKKKEA